MLAIIFMFLFMVSLILCLIFFLISKKEKWELEFSSSFECGFMSYFYSRFSFSIHYFLIAMIFLLLDLELCILLPMLNLHQSNFSTINFSGAFVIILLWGLMKEWKEGKIVWLK